MGTTQTRKQPAYYDVMDRDDLYETRMPSSARRYKPTYTTTDDFARMQHITTTTIQRRSSASQRTGGIASTAVRPTRMVEKHTQEIGVQEREQPKRFYTTIIIGMCVTIALLIGLSFLVSWWQGFQEDMTYGNPRTAQIDAVVGHNDSPANPTHFIFINLHGHIQIIEIQGGDAAKTRVYTGPTLYGANKDSIPVTGAIVDQQGSKNLVVHVGSQDLLFINDGKTFKLRQ